MSRWFHKSTACLRKIQPTVCQDKLRTAKRGWCRISSGQGESESLLHGLFLVSDAIFSNANHCSRPCQSAEQLGIGLSADSFLMDPF